MFVIRLSGIQIYADGSISVDIDPNSTVVDSGIRYVFTFESAEDTLGVVHAGNIVDIRFSPLIATAVSNFYDRLTADSSGRAILTDDEAVEPTLGP